MKDRSHAAFERYLLLLGVEPGPPRPGLLRRLVRAQLTRVPFENVSKLFAVRTRGAREMPGLERYVDEMERYRFGGTCYPNNIHFGALLRHLGFDASLRGAEMRGTADVHVVIVVRLEDREYLVDTGYGAPFHEPLRRDLSEEQAVSLGHERYVLRPRDGAGRSRVDHYRDGKRVHGYVAAAAPREPAHFDAIIRDSYAETAMFMNALRLVRFFDDRSVSIHNLTLVESTQGGARVTRLPDLAAAAAVVELHFGIPEAIVREATAGFDPQRLRDVLA